MTDRERLVELLEQTGMLDSKGRCEIAAAELLANGVIVPPCEVGDIIYHLYPIQGIVAKKVKRIQYGSYGLMIADGNGVFHSDVIGKTVFLTKEEAEEKLRERKEDEGE